VLYAVLAVAGLLVGILGLRLELALLALRDRTRRRDAEADGEKPTATPHAPNPTRPLLEQVGLPLLLALIFTLLGWRYSWSAPRVELVLACIYSALLFEIAVIDFHTRLVLDVLSFPAGVIAVAGAVLWSGIGFGSALLAGAVALALFLVIEIVGRGAMGRGDTKLAAVIGLMRGFPGVWQALVIGILVGGLFAVGFLVSGRSRRSTFAYGPALAIGAVVSMLVTPH